MQERSRQRRKSSSESQGPGRTARTAYRRSRSTASKGKWRHLEWLPEACPVALRYPKKRQSDKGRSTEALGAGRTAKKASRRPGRTPKYRTARGTAYFSTLLATFGVASEAHPKVFGRSKVIRALQESSAEALRPSRTARKASRRRGRTVYSTRYSTFLHTFGDTRRSSGSTS